MLTPPEHRAEEIRAMLRATRHMMEAAHQQARVAIERSREIRTVLHSPRLDEVEHALASAREALEGQHKTVAAVSHELRQAIGAVVAAWSVVRASPTSAVAERARSTLDRQLDLMRQLVDDLTDMSRLNFDSAVLIRQRVAIQEIVQAAIDSVKPIIDKEHHELHLSMPDEPLAIDADPIRLQQVFSNLLTNAAIYTPDGGHIDVQVTAPSLHSVGVVIRDNGQGIPAEFLRTMFEPFARGSVSQHGLGLGLAIAEGFVRLHGGTIDAHSDGVGHGSEFVVTLPRAAEQPAAISRS